MIASTNDPHDHVFDNVERRRFEMVVDGRFVGFLSYRLEAGAVVLDHAEVLPEERGKGLGRRLVAAVLDGLRDQGVPVDPACPFVARFIEDHAEYASMVAT